jgi:RNA 2',3'-cyclic 3'-phosphodiesterase
MRLFVALEIPASLHLEIARLRQELEPRLPRARWVRPEGIHLTLLFLGEVEEGAVAALRSGLAAAFARHPPLTLAMRGAGTFPPGRPARVAWLGMEARPELAPLQAAVTAAAVAALGIEPERRPFHPHLTLARPDPPWRRPEAERFTAAADRPFGDPFDVDRGVLMRSHLGRGGARYEVAAALPLGGGP